MRYDPTIYQGSAAYYAQGRPPYARALVPTLATALGLDGTGRLLDVGCGPGSGRSQAGRGPSGGADAARPHVGEDSRDDPLDWRAGVHLQRRGPPQQRLDGLEIAEHLG